MDFQYRAINFNLGIGTTSPGAKLHIDGNLELGRGSVSSGDNPTGEVDLANGLQMKWGYKTSQSGSTTIDFTNEGLSDFSNACLFAIATIDDTGTDTGATTTQTLSTSSVIFHITDGGTSNLRWFAMGY